MNKLAQVSIEVVLLLVAFCGIFMYMDYKKTTEANQFHDQSQQVTHTAETHPIISLINLTWSSSGDTKSKISPVKTVTPVTVTPVATIAKEVVTTATPITIPNDTLLLVFSIIATIGLAVFCGWMFRIGGASGENARWARMLGVEIAEFFGLVIWFVIRAKFPITFTIFWHTFSLSLWVVLVSIFLTTALSWTECTYFKSKGTSATWINWMFCGIQYSLIPLPLVLLGIIPWVGFLIRFVVLVPVITLWRTFQGDVDWSEGGAGAWQIVTLPLLTIT